VRLLFEASDERACPSKYDIEVIDAKEQQEAISGRPATGAHQGWMIVGAPLMKTQQDRTIGIEDLPKVVMGGKRSRLIE
jgi:hypothetical protein